MPTALLIIDVQQVLCSGIGAAFEVERVIDRINLVSQKVRASGALVVIIQHETEGTGGFGPRTRAVPANEVQIEA